MSQVKVLKVEFPPPPQALMTRIDPDLPEQAARDQALKALVAAATAYVRANAKEAMVEQEKK